MFANENFECLDKTIRLNIMNTKGEIYIVNNLNENITVENLKNICLSYFRKTSPWDNLGYSFRLVSTQQKKSLLDNKKTLKEEQIANNDFLIMKKKKSISSSDSDKRYETVTKQQIAEATKSILNRNNLLEDRLFIQTNHQNNFCKDIRKVLITLVDYSETLLRENERVKKVFNFSNEVVEEKLNFIKEEVVHEMDYDSLKKLTDMGFSDLDAKRALKLNNMNTIDAMDYLIKESSNSKANTDELNKNDTDDKNEVNSFKQTYYNEIEIYDKVPKLVQNYRKFKRHTFFYNKKSFDNMKAIGFDQEEICDSLWIFNNNEHLACEWLLSNRRPKLDELKVGLVRDSSLHRSLIKNPIIQLGLLKEPNLNRWLSDNEIQPIITQIFREYHSEKETINQAAFMNQKNAHSQANQPNQPNQHCQSRGCLTRNYSIDDHFNSDYSTRLIPEILSNLSLNETTNQEHSSVNWNLNADNHATLV